MSTEVILEKVREFLKYEAASGILLFIAAILAMIAVNSDLEVYYESLLDIPVAIQFGNFEIAKPLLMWINDGLMAIFFFLIGLEVKREVLAGELSDPARVTLPVIAAIGGMAVPAAVYVAINWGNPDVMHGWAIPSATDIAFALGVLALLGSRIPQSLKLFLMTLAIIDDLGAIVIIALFYTDGLSVTSLYFAVIAMAVLFTMNRRGVLPLAPYILVGIVFWAAVLKSGVHATLAGVITAFFIPFRKAPGQRTTQLEHLEHDLHPTVAFVILPIFAFANAGVSFDGLTMDSFMHTVPLGIAMGLVIGKQIGVFGFSWVAVKLGFAKLPTGATWGQLYGVAALCGIGFTMSLFIASLAFEPGALEVQSSDRLGIITGSLLSGTLGYLLLRYLTSSKQTS